MPLDIFLKNLKPTTCGRVPGTAVFMTGDVESVPTALLHNLKHNKVLHERVVLMNVHTEDIPHVPEERRIEITHIEHNFHIVRLNYGFMDEPNIPRALAQCRVLQFRFNLMETSFFLRREKIVAAQRAPFARWRKQVFILMAQHDAQRHRVLPHPDQPRHRARRARSRSEPSSSPFGCLRF